MTLRPRRDDEPALLFGFLAAALLGSSIYTVDAREAVVVTLFGKPVKTVTEPGLQAGLPWPLHQVVRFDKRTQLLSVETAEVLTGTRRTSLSRPSLLCESAILSVSSRLWARLEIANTQLSDLVASRIAAALGNRDFGELMTTEGDAVSMLPDNLLNGIAEIGKERPGIEALDVRLRHLGLPLQNEQSIYERMRAERVESRTRTGLRAKSARRSSVQRQIVRQRRPRGRGERVDGHSGSCRWFRCQGLRRGL